MLLIFIDGTAKNSGQRLDNVNRTHPVLASGKLELQKILDPMDLLHALPKGKL